MNRVALATAAVLLATGIVAAAHDAKAEVAGPVMTQRQAAKQLPAEAIQARIDQARIDMGGAKTFIINGRRVLVPSDANADAIIKALKARYPGLQSDDAATRSVAAIEEK
ncbi:MAG: hypothetical protein K0Q70_61 [Rhodospirillales bacterium]|jgi:hypothetical protein|nr:hypothetical protein [Rhodospirillales bacterium]